MIVSRTLYNRKKLLQENVVGNIESAFATLEMIEAKVAEDLGMDVGSRQLWRTYVEQAKHGMARAINAIDTVNMTVVEEVPMPVSFTMQDGELVQDKQFKPITEVPF